MMAPYPPRPHAAAPARLRTNDKAVASLVLGIISLVGFGFLAGVPAIVLGALARRDCERSHGQLDGAGLAAGGIVSGLFGTGVSLIVLVAVLGFVVPAALRDEPPAEQAVRVPVAAGTRSYGTLQVVDLEEGRPLRPQLAELARSAGPAGRVLMLQTYVRSSRECAQIAASLPDPRMQRALAQVTLVRVDVQVFESELREMRLETDTVPWFYKLDTRARPTDALSADEWDENVPENMAPVLGHFARGTLESRRVADPLGIDL